MFRSRRTPCSKTPQLIGRCASLGRVRWDLTGERAEAKGEARAHIAWSRAKAVMTGAQMINMAGTKRSASVSRDQPRPAKVDCLYSEAYDDAIWIMMAWLMMAIDGLWPMHVAKRCGMTQYAYSAKSPAER